jgi:hypothetical protein
MHWERLLVHKTLGTQSQKTRRSEIKCIFIKSVKHRHRAFAKIKMQPRYRNGDPSTALRSLIQRENSFGKTEVKQQHIRKTNGKEREIAACKSEKPRKQNVYFTSKQKGTIDTTHLKVLNTSPPTHPLKKLSHIPHVGKYMTWHSNQQARPIVKCFPGDY